MCHKTGWVAVTAALLAGAPLIACAQGGSSAGAASSTAAADEDRPAARSDPGAGESLPNTGGQDTERAWLRPCPQPPPYISQPCIPAKR
jgi:hypothetical protein